MTSRINYNTPLKSVRTIRALKIEQCDPETIFVSDPVRLSDADLMKEAGIAFVWENEPGRSKVEQEKSDAAAASVELKLPPQQILPPPPASKVPSVEVPKSPPPAGTSPAAGTNSRHSYNLFANSQVSPPEAAAYTSAPNSRSKSSANHQLPPKPSQSRAPPSVTVHQQQSSDKPPPLPRRTASASVPQSGHHNSTSLSHNGGCDPQSGQRISGTRGGENPVTTEDHHLSSLASTLHSLKNDAAVPHSDLNRGSDFSSDGERRTGPYSDLNRGSQDYLAERLRLAPMHVVKDFYLSGRHTPAGTVPSSAQATRPNSCMPTRPNSASASETGSHSDDGDQTDAGDAGSQINMNPKDFDARCQVSTLDGELHETSRHTDPHARDFIMERFLPAAKAMVTETAEASDRRSTQGIPSVSPTRGKGRPSLPGRSRFAFKDRFAEGEEQQEDIDQSGMLFKSKFPWQMGALKGAGQVSTPPDSSSVEQSPSASFANAKGSSPGPYNYDQHNAVDSDGSTTPKGDNSGSFEDRRLPSKYRSNNGSYIPRSQTSRIGETDNRDSNRTLGELASREYERELTRRSNDTSSRQFLGVPTDRLDETATHGDCDNGNSSNGPRGKRSPVMAFSGSLGTLLKATQLQRRDHGKNSGLGNPAAAANVQESIPPSSILNHHRYNHSHAAAAYDSTNSAGKPIYHSNGVHPNENNSYPRHLNVNLIRRQNAEPSGGSGSSLESLHDDVWEAGREPISGSKSPAPDNYDSSGKVFTTSNLPEAANDEMHAAGWPLGKGFTAYARTPSSDSKDASFSSISDHSLQSPSNHGLTLQSPSNQGLTLQSPSNQGLSIQSNQQEKSSSEKFSPVSVLQPPLPKSPAESWLFKVRPPVPPSMVTNWQGPKPKKFLDYSLTDDSMDVKWEVLVKSENAQLRNKLAQEVQQKVPGLDKSEILGSKAR